MPARLFKRFDLVQYKGRACIVTENQDKEHRTVNTGCLMRQGGFSVDQMYQVNAAELKLLKPSHEVKDLLDITPRQAGSLKEFA